MGLTYRLAAASILLAAVATASCDRRETAAKHETTKQETAVLPAIRYEAHIPAGGNEPAGQTLDNPFKGDAQKARAGAQLFASMNCDGCHGGGGAGWVGPSLADGRWRYGGADKEVFYSIFHGRPKGMPAYGGVAGVEGTWMLVTYLKSLPVPDNVPTQSYKDSDDAAVAVAEPIAPAAPAAAVVALNAEGMLAKYACVACHAIDKKVVGPSFKDVAQKYRGQRDIDKVLAEKVKNGGGGTWGQVAMIPNPGVPNEDLHTMIAWILVLK